MTPKAFGEKIAANIDWLKLLQGAGRGGAAGAALGGVAGLFAPGTENVYNDKGKVVGQKQRNRLAAGIRGAFWSGLGGAGLGATADYMNPGTTKAIYDMARRVATGKQQHELNMQDNVARLPYPQQQIHQAIMHRQKFMREHPEPFKPAPYNWHQPAPMKLPPEPWESGKFMSPGEVANSENGNL